MIAILMFLAWLGLLAVVLCLFAGGTETACTQDCNQGRSCTCAKSTDA